MKFKCRYCGRAISVKSGKDAPHYPFCCERCKMADLGNWFDGAYRFSRPLARPAEDGEEPGDL